MLDASTHIFFDNGQPRLYERRLRQIITDGNGVPLRTLPDGIGASTILKMLRRGEKLKRAYVLIPITHRD